MIPFTFTSAPPYAKTSEDFALTYGLWWTLASHVQVEAVWSLWGLGKMGGEKG